MMTCARGQLLELPAGNWRCGVGRRHLRHLVDDGKQGGSGMKTVERGLCYGVFRGECEMYIGLCRVISLYCILYVGLLQRDWGQLGDAIVDGIKQDGRNKLWRWQEWKSSPISEV